MSVTLSVHRISEKFPSLNGPSENSTPSDWHGNGVVGIFVYVQLPLHETSPEGRETVKSSVVLNPLFPQPPGKPESAPMKCSFIDGIAHDSDREVSVSGAERTAGERAIAPKMRDL